jgi:HSP20 family molecular chaperone IbpA
MERRPRWMPPFADWIDDLPFDLRLPGEHMIRVEESTTEGTWTMKAELPGVDPDKDVDITVQDGVLTVHAERTEEATDTKHRSEFRYGSFTRSVELPPGVKDEDITADYDSGVLTVTAPVGTPAETEPHRVRIARKP